MGVCTCVESVREGQSIVEAVPQVAPTSRQTAASECEGTSHIDKRTHTILFNISYVMQNVLYSYNKR